MMRRVRGWAFTSCLVALATTLAVPYADAASTNHNIAGFQSAIGCLSADLCVAVGYASNSLGDVVALKDGVSVHTSAVAAASALSSVSCPTSAGCVALGRSTSGTRADFATINGAGTVTRVAAVTPPAGVTLTRISCVSTTNCEIVGTDFFTTPASIEIGSWNGSRVVLHRLGGPAGSTSVSMEAIGCSAGVCDAVGYADKGATVTGLVVRESASSSFHVASIAGDSLYAVACVSTTLCDAAGFDAAGGVVLSVTAGTPARPVAVSSDLFAIACAGSTCDVAGKKLSTPPDAAPFVGTLSTIVGHTVRSSVSIIASGGFNGIALAGGHFAAVGAAQRTGSEVTTG